MHFPQQRTTDHAIVPTDAQAPRLALLHHPHCDALWLPEALREEGLEIIATTHAEHFVDVVQNGSIDLTLLAGGPRGLDDLDMLDWIRAHHCERLPAIVLMGQHDPEHVVQGLERGADDVLSIAVGQRELLARIKAHALRCQPAPLVAQALRHGMHTLELQTRCMRVGSGRERETVRLSSREFSLMLHLFQNPGRMVSKDTLIAAIWGEVDRRFDATLCTYISKLRNALGLRARNGLVISTVYNQGYRLERVPIPQHLRKLASCPTSTSISSMNPPRTNTAKSRHPIAC